MEAQYVQHNLSCPGLGLEGRCDHTRNSLHSCLWELARLRPWKGPRPALGVPGMPVVGGAQDAWQVLMNKADAAMCPLGSTRPGCSFAQAQAVGPMCWYL